MKFVFYKCDCGCYFAIHTFNDSNDLKCPACWDDTGVKSTNEFIVKVEKNMKFLTEKEVSEIEFEANCGRRISAPRVRMLIDELRFHKSQSDKAQDILRLSLNMLAIGESEQYKEQARNFLFDGVQSLTKSFLDAKRSE